MRLLRAFLGSVSVGLASLSGQVTESPYTIPPGRLLVEMDGIRLSYDRADAAGNKFTGIAVASTLVSAGLTNSVDIQVGVDFFLKQTFEFRGARDSRSGIGDLHFRTKWTFWRDDKAESALAVIPYVKVPSNTGGLGNHFVEGGFIVPWAMQVGAGFTAGAMFQWAHLRNHDNDGYDAHWSLSGYARRNLTRAFALYAETTLDFTSAGLSDWTGRIGAGALLRITRSVELDYEFLRGMNRDATDWMHVFRVNWEW